MSEQEVIEQTVIEPVNEKCEPTELTLDDVLVSPTATKVLVEKLNKYVWFRDLTPSDFKIQEGETGHDLSLRMLIKAWVKEDGTPFFTSVEQANNGSKLKFVQNVSLKLNKFLGIAEDSVELAEKN